MTRDNAGSWIELERLFDRTTALDDEAIKAMLDELAADRPALAAELRALVVADRGGDVIAEHLQRFAEAEFDLGGLRSGDRVGAYAIRHLLGRGGMGAVYLAERDDGNYRQQVVVKLLDAPMSGSLRARFQRERQILADLNHPHIARLLDGGSLDDGTPYLVMEYIDGTSISAYCDDHALDVRACIELFRQVAEAVQFAHANLIVHRDIKPDNVFVDRDGRVRLLDFGIAKLLEEPALAELASLPDAPAVGDRTLHGAALLSPAYASPEQLRGETITTASDVYSLGALLYRLLTGHAPRDQAVDTATGTASPSAVVGRDKPRRAARALRGDVDAIVARAMAEDPGRRYRSAGALIDDLDRWLGDRPVAARRSGWLDQTAKFARRNRALAATLAATAVIVLGFSIGVSTLAVRLADERAVALESAQTTEQIADYLVGLFAAADPAENPGANLTARELLDRGVERIGEQPGMDPTVRSRLLHQMALAYRNLGLRDDAVPLYEQAMALSLADSNDEIRTWQLRLELADLLREIGEHDEAGARLRAAIAELERAGGPAEMLAKAYNDYGIVAEVKERPDEAERWARSALAVAETLPADRENRIRKTRFRHNLAIALSGQGRYPEAIAVFDEVIATKRELIGERHPSTLRSLEVLASTYREANRLDRAAELLTEALALRKAVFGPDAVSVANAGNGLANTYHDAGRYSDAERVYREALAICEKNPTRAPLLHAFLINNLASLYEDRGDLARAEPLFRDSAERRIALSGPDALAVVRARINLARLLIKRRGLQEAGRLLDEIDRTLARNFPDNRYRALLAEAQRARLEAASGDERGGWRRMQRVLAGLRAGGVSAAVGLRRARIEAAEMRLAAGRADEALALLDAVEAALPETLTPAHPKRQVLRVLRAQALLALGRAEEARSLAATAVENLAGQFAPDADILRRARAVMATSDAPPA